jgi:hypothetical protein
MEGIDDANSHITLLYSLSALDRLEVAAGMRQHSRSLTRQPTLGRKEDDHEFIRLLDEMQRQLSYDKVPQQLR